ncbi:MAG: nicotinate phosphoribosyltransferase [Candidatus Thermoplasmatota archaeon]
MVKFYTASDKEIEEGETTDIYFKNTKEILEKKNVNKRVTAEFTYHSETQDWAVFAGLEEMINLFEGKNIDFYALPEGTIFTPFSKNDVPVPVVVIEGDYTEFGIYETPSLGLICQASGISTKTAKIRRHLKDKKMISFGVRRMHPSITPMIDRSAFIGGCDGVSSIIGAERINEKPVGTMPHALLLIMGDKEGWKAYDEIMPSDTPRVALVDTFDDEKFSALNSAEVLETLDSVRLDTPSSRKGSFTDLIREVRWELDNHGYHDVKIFVSGGINEESIKQLVDEPVDGFGIGTSISSASTINYAMDLVAIEDKPLAKRGKYSGRKKVYRDKKDLLNYYVTPWNDDAPKDFKPMLKKYLDNGEKTEEMPNPQKIRNYVLKQLENINETEEKG